MNTRRLLLSSFIFCNLIASTSEAKNNEQQCLPKVSVGFDEEDCLFISSSKDLSNIVVQYCDGSAEKFDNLSDPEFTLCSNVSSVWVKSGCNGGNDCPVGGEGGCGERFDVGDCPTPTSTPVPPTATPTKTPEPTQTPEPTSTPWVEETPTPEPTVTPEPSKTPCSEETPTPTPTETPQPTSTPWVEETPTPDPTVTPEPTSTPWVEETPTPTPTETPVACPVVTFKINKKKLLLASKHMHDIAYKYFRRALDCSPTVELVQKLKYNDEVFEAQKKAIDRLITKVRVCPGDCQNEVNRLTIKRMRALTRVQIQLDRESQYASINACNTPPRKGVAGSSDRLKSMINKINKCPTKVCN